MYSKLFFQVVQFDTRFQSVLAKGRLYCMITLTGDRTILPIACAWTPSEKIDYTDMLFKMLKNEISLIKSCHTDDSDALISSIEKVNIQNILCTWHMSLHIVGKGTLKKLVSATNSHKYGILKNEVIQFYDDLNKYLNIRNPWKKISRFEYSPRDQNYATVGVESFNTLISIHRLF